MIAPNAKCSEIKQQQNKNKSVTIATSNFVKSPDSSGINIEKFVNWGKMEDMNESRY